MTRAIPLSAASFTTFNGIIFMTFLLIPSTKVQWQYRTFMKAVLIWSIRMNNCEDHPTKIVKPEGIMVIVMGGTVISSFLSHRLLQSECNLLFYLIMKQGKMRQLDTKDDVPLHGVLFWKVIKSSVKWQNVITETCNALLILREQLNEAEIIDWTITWFGACSIWAEQVNPILNMMMLHVPRILSFFNLIWCHTAA